MSALVSILKERGVAEKDIQTSQVNVQPQYSQPRPPRPGAESAQEFVPRIVSYQVTNMVRVTSRDLTKLGTILDAVVSAGANQIHGISFRIDEPDKLLDQARKQAMADAKHRAELMAGEAGVVVGPPIAIRESEAVPIAQPMYMGRMAMEAAAPAAPIAAGEQELSVRVDVTYRLVLPKTGGD
jgi:uncharacterized protein YggE